MSSRIKEFQIQNFIYKILYYSDKKNYFLEITNNNYPNICIVINKFECTIWFGNFKNRKFAYHDNIILSKKIKYRNLINLRNIHYEYKNEFEDIFKKYL